MSTGKHESNWPVTWSH